MNYSENLHGHFTIYFTKHKKMQLSLEYIYAVWGQGQGKAQGK